MKIAGFEFVCMIWTISHFSEAFPKFDFNLCGYMIHGGTCHDTCQYEARHKWGIDLCAHNTSHSNKCCIPLDHPLIKAKHEASTTTTKTTTTATTTPESTTSVTIATTTSDTKSTQATCGYSKPHSRVRRLVGGKRAPRGAWAWQVALRMYTGRYVCGGVVISDRWLLTAAHCLQSYEGDEQYIRVFVGEQTLSYDKSGAKHSKGIKQIILHEDFHDNVTLNVTDIKTDSIITTRRHFHDLALIELQEPLTFSKNIQPICLPDSIADDTVIAEDVNMTSDNIDYNDCWVAGWGEHSDSDEEHIQYMKEVHGRVIDHKECGNHWGTNFTDDVVCFTSKGRRGPCKGDSGGGVSCRRADGRYSLVGVISWGREDCEHDKHPSVLTNVQTYRNWIDIRSHLKADI